MIDAMVEPDYMRKVVEACEDALLFASSCILGYQVYDGYLAKMRCARSSRTCRSSGAAGSRA